MGALLNTLQQGATALGSGIMNAGEAIGDTVMETGGKLMDFYEMPDKKAFGELYKGSAEGPVRQKDIDAAFKEEENKIKMRRALTGGALGGLAGGLMHDPNQNRSVTTTGGTGALGNGYVPAFLRNPVQFRGQ